MAFDEFFDEYSRTARLQPALYTLLPLVVTTWTWARPIFDVGAALLSVAVASGLFVLLAHFSRALGVRRQIGLIKKWGGMPTTIFLRHSDKTIDVHTKGRYHRTLEKLCPEAWSAPSETEEVSDAEDADSRYLAAVRWLISNTYDKKRFRMLFKENVSYGFRRNLLGLKPVGIAVCLICVLVNALALASLLPGIKGSSDTSPLSGVLSLALSIVLLLLWVRLVSESFVREAADAYAYQLLNTIDQIGVQTGEGR